MKNPNRSDLALKVKELNRVVNKGNHGPKSTSEIKPVMTGALAYSLDDHLLPRQNNRFEATLQRLRFQVELDELFQGTGEWPKEENNAIN